MYDSPEQLNLEISAVSQQLHITAQNVLPVCKTPSGRRKWYKDQALAQLAAHKKAAYDKWSSNGRPTEGL